MENPRIFQQILGAGPLCWIGHQEVANKQLGRLLNLRPGRIVIERILCRLPSDAMHSLVFRKGNNNCNRKETE